MDEVQELTLEVGKTYATRKGYDRVTITHKRVNTFWAPFVGDNGRDYMPNGYQAWDGNSYVPLHNDLVKEIEIG